MPEKTLLDILGEKGVELKKEGSITRAFCPFHNDTGRPNFTFYPDTDSWFCFACNEGGDAAAFLSKIEGISYADAKTRISGVGLNLEALQESLDGLFVPEEEPRLNEELNVLVSKLMRHFLLENPKAMPKVLTILKEFDLKLLLPVNPKRMTELIDFVKTKLGE